MTTYYAAVKYALDAPKAEKAKALRDGLETIAMALVEEFGWTADEVQDALDIAASAAEWSAAGRAAVSGEAGSE